MAHCFIGLGGNLGNVRQTFDESLSMLADSDVRIVRVADPVETSPVGSDVGNSFLNSAARLETSLDPHSLLSRLLEIETALGRIRSGRWMPRPLDLDLLFYDERIIDSPRLQVPHPAMWYRRFVLEPLTSIADVIHPVKHLSVVELLDRLNERPLTLELAGGTLDERQQIIDVVSAEFPQAVVAHRSPPAHFVAARGPEPAIIVCFAGEAEAGDSGWQATPLISRLDASEYRGDRLDFVRNVLVSALPRQ